MPDKASPSQISTETKGQGRRGGLRDKIKSLQSVTKFLYFCHKINQKPDSILHLTTTNYPLSRQKGISLSVSFFMSHYLLCDIILSN